jgi:chromate transport protein ChrA
MAGYGNKGKHVTASKPSVACRTAVYAIGITATTLTTVIADLLLYLASYYVAWMPLPEPAMRRPGIAMTATIIVFNLVYVLSRSGHDRNQPETAAPHAIILVSAAYLAYTLGLLIAHAIRTGDTTIAITLTVAFAAVIGGTLIPLPSRKQRHHAKGRHQAAAPSTGKETDKRKTPAHRKGKR